MKHQPILLLLLLGISMGSQAQKDSINLRSVNGLLEQQLYEQYKQQAPAMSVSPVKYYAIAGIFAQSDKGQYRSVQTPGKSSSAAFMSEGMKKVDHFWVQGNFQYKRQWDEEVNNSLRRDPNDRSPYYLWTPRTGDMNHEIYHLDGQFATAIAKNKLWIGAGAAYDASDNYRTIDPRPFINYFNFDVKAVLGYQITQQHLLVIEPHFGYSKENSSAYSKNNDSVNAAAYQIYRAEGLAEVSSASESKRQMEQWRNYSGIGIGYYFQHARIGNWFLKYDYIDNKEKNFNRFYNPTSITNYSRVGYFDHQLQLGWNRRYQHWMALWNWQLNLQKSKDYNYYLSGVNHTLFARSNQFQVGLSRLINQKPVHEWLFTYRNTLHDQKDGNNSARAEYRHHQYHLQYRLNVYSGYSLVQLTVQGGISENNNGKLDLPKSAFDYLFVPAVTYPDAEFQTTNNWQLGMKIGYNSLAPKKLRWGIDLATAYTRNSKTGIYYTESGFHPGKSRVNWSAALRFFL